MPQFVFAGAEAFLLRQKLDQSGLPRPVHTNERNALAALNHKINFFKHLVLVGSRLAVAFSDAHKLRNNPSTGLRLREREMHGLLFVRNLNPLHLF